MENRRMILIALIGVVIYLLWQAWQAEHGKNSPAALAVNQPAGATVALPQAGTAGADAGSISVHTDLLDAVIARDGGELRRVELRAYPASQQNPERKLALLDDAPERLLTLTTGIAGTDNPLTTNQTVFQAPQAEYSLVTGADTVEVPLDYTDSSGYSVHKVFSFKRGSYEIALSQTLVNHSGHVLTAAAYARWQRTPPADGSGPKFVGSFNGVGVYQQKEGGGSYSYKSEQFKKLDDNPRDVKQTGGWIAVVQHYFLAAIIPPPDQAAEFSSKRAAGTSGPLPVYQAQYLGPLVPVADGGEHQYPLRLYIGPEDQDHLGGIAPGLELTMNYGLLRVFADLLFAVMSFFHKLTGNWGWSILLLTCTVRTLFFPLTAAQYRSMAKMRKYQPRIQELRERFADDREKLNKAMMDLYRKEGFNPLAGCWPLVIQMPIFYALYRVLAQSVELRQAPFVLWMHDLSAADPYYIMPVLYGISMWVQQRMSGQNATMDPTQQKMMNVMPIALTGLFLFFPVGLVLYWFVSNSIGIVQQWLITKRLQK